MLLRVHFSLGYGIQERARDTQRKHDIKTIARALEMYYIEHGSYPIISGTYYWHSTYPIDGNTANTFVPDSWNELKEHLSPYIDDIGDDPKNSEGRRLLIMLDAMAMTTPASQMPSGAIFLNAPVKLTTSSTSLNPNLK